jgi:6-phosphogluconolactonase (cycloisomerase 2 family)
MASPLSALGAALLVACGPGMETTAPTMPMMSATADRAAHPVGALYTMSNAADGNSVLAFARGAGGELAVIGSYLSGGAGTGAGLGNQGGLALDEDGNTLVVVNAGSDEISAFRVEADGSLQLTDKVSSGGTTPISATISHGIVYVLNAGGAGNISGFALERGRLAPIGGSTRSLSASDVGPAQVAFDPTGRWLVVTEKGTSRLSTFAVDRSGLASGPTTTSSSGTTPFGFAFTNNGTLVVSEAFGGAVDGSAVSSYSSGGNGTWSVITGSAATTETAACWIAVTADGRFAYTTNAGSGTITGYAVKQGALSRLDASGVTANIGAGSSPTEMAVSRNSQFLYALAGGLHAVVTYRVKSDGSLQALGTVSGLPNAANGLAAR